MTFDAVCARCSGYGWLRDVLLKLAGMSGFPLTGWIIFYRYKLVEATIAGKQWPLVLVTTLFTQQDIHLLRLIKPGKS